MDGSCDLRLGFIVLGVHQCNEREVLEEVKAARV